MINIAIVEDQQQDAELLIAYIERFRVEQLTKGQPIHTTVFSNPILFLQNYTPVYDIVFMDIQMPQMNGMDVAGKLREKDRLVQLVFVTNMSNYAVRGYAVDAVDFVVKPINYLHLSQTLKKILKVLKNNAQEVVLKTAGGIKRIPANSVLFIEVQNHRLIYHTLEGDIVFSGTLKEQEGKLSAGSFARCNDCYLVNLKYVEEVCDGFVNVRGEKVPISRSKKKPFIQSLLKFYGNIGEG